MQLMRRVAGWIVAALLVAYFAWFAWHALEPGLLHALLGPGVAVALLLAALLYAAIIPITAWSWARLLGRQGETWRATTLAVLLGRVQLAKYIPGNVAQHAGRAVLALRAGMGARPLAVTVIQETLLAVAASVLVGVVALALSEAGMGQLPQGSRAFLLGFGAVLAVAVLALSAFDLAPSVLIRSPSRLARLVGRLGGLPGAGVILPVLGGYALNYILIGLGLWLVARAAGLPSELDLLLATAAFALSWLLGFLAPGAPAGLGVREGIMVLLLSGIVSDADALSFVLLARLVTLLGDAIVYLASWMPDPRGERPKTT